MYYPGLDIVLALLYLLIIWWEASYKNLSLFLQCLVGLAWQLPALYLSLSIIMGLDQATDFSYYFVFMLQLWHTPVMPLATLMPNLIRLDKPFYYYELFVFAPLLWTIYLLPWFRRKKLLQKKFNPLA
ncbi:MAG: hypothetical protein H6Q64_103 [Firmicutes bacterium]|nr:hypothetical protein [Bacillota bacterium]